MGRCILVLSTGRSGTSIVAGMLAALGVKMGESFMPASRHNPYGTFEDRAWFRHARDVLGGAEPEYASLIKMHDGDEVWGVKDPALAHVAQHILPLLEDVRVVVARRPWEQSVRSFARAYGHTMIEALAWHQNVSAALEQRLAEYDGPILELEYADMLNEPQETAVRLAAFAYEGIGEATPEQIEAAAAHVRPPLVDFDDQKVAIGHPLIGGSPTWGLYKTLMDLDKPAGYKVSLTRESGLPVDVARNEICRWFLENTRADWLLMTDGDAVLHEDTLRRMMSWDKPVVSALAFLRFRPCFPSLAYWRPERKLYRFAVPEVRQWIADHRLSRAKVGPWVIYPRPDDGLWLLREHNGYTGAHCVLFKREALEAIKAPWFHRLKNLVGEDRFFFAKAQVSGVDTYVDMTTVAGHLAGEGYSLGVADFLLWDSLFTDEAWDVAHALIK